MSGKINVIAIDGPAASGKSTLAKYLADKLGYLYIDTGAMYRAITYYALENNIAEDEDAVVESVKGLDIKLRYKNGVTSVFINGKDITDKIRSPEVNAKVSDISKIKDVRTELVKLQQNFGNSNNLVVEGRDTTTVVFPEADLKIFLTAEVSERARRRYLEFKEKDVDIELSEVEKSIKNRDRIDSGRDVSPLKKADDAIELDTTNLTVDQEIDSIVNIVEDLTGEKFKKPS